MNPSWTTRVSLTRDRTAIVRTRSHSLLIGQPLDFGSAAPGTSALEAMLGALGSDIVLRFSDLCDRRRLVLDQIEARVEGQLSNPLFALGVIGEEGDPSLSKASVTLSVVSVASEIALRNAFEETLLRSPLVSTLRKCAALKVEIQLL